MIVVAGPRIDPDSLPRCDGVEMRGFVPDLPQHFAACDLALVQGGLTTCMELAAAGTPFLYFPLRNHFEQNFHVRHRLERYARRPHRWTTPQPRRKSWPRPSSRRSAGRSPIARSKATAPAAPRECWPS